MEKTFKFYGKLYEEERLLKESIARFLEEDQYVTSNFAVIKLAVPVKGGGYMISPFGFAGQDFYHLAPEARATARFMFNAHVDGCLLQGISYKECLLALDIAREKYFKKHYCDAYEIEYEDGTTELVPIEVDYQPLEI